MSRESGTLCSFNLENNTTFTRIKTFDPLAYATSFVGRIYAREQLAIHYHLAATVGDCVAKRRKKKKPDQRISHDSFCYPNRPVVKEVLRYF